jgi:hypothetical protein
MKAIDKRTKEIIEAAKQLENSKTLWIYPHRDTMEQVNAKVAMAYALKKYKEITQGKLKGE